MAAVISTSPDLSASKNGQFDEDDRVVTHESPESPSSDFMGIAATDKQVAIEAVDIW